jgi:hypothetical protein
MLLPDGDMTGDAEHPVGRAEDRKDANPHSDLLFWIRLSIRPPDVLVDEPDVSPPPFRAPRQNEIRSVS